MCLNFFSSVLLARLHWHFISKVHQEISSTQQLLPQELCPVTHQPHVRQDKAHQASTHPIFFLLEVNNLMDWRRRKDILDSKIPSSFKTSSLLRPAEESLTDTLSAGLLSLIYRRKTTPNNLTEFHLLNTGSDLKTPLAGELTFTCVTQTASKGHTHQHILQVILDWGIRNIIHTGYRQPYTH